MCVCFYQWKWGPNFIFQENNIKFFVKAKNLLFLNNSPFSPTLPFLEKIFYHHSYCHISGTELCFLFMGYPNTFSILFVRIISVLLLLSTFDVFSKFNFFYPQIFFELFFVKPNVNYLQPINFSFLSFVILLEDSDHLVCIFH